METHGSPLTESNGNWAVDSMAKGDNHVEIVMVDMPPNRTCSLGLNCQVFLDSSIPIQLTRIINSLYVLIYILFRSIKQVGKLLLRQPYVIVFKTRHDSRLPADRPIHGKPPRQIDLGFLFSHHSLLVFI